MTDKQTAIKLIEKYEKMLRPHIKVTNQKLRELAKLTALGEVEENIRHWQNIKAEIEKIEKL